MSKDTLLDKIWKLHTVKQLPTGQTQLFIGLHLIHEVTSPQAFSILKEINLRVAFPDRAFATVDHVIPTDSSLRPLNDPMAEKMLVTLERNVEECGIRFFNLGNKNNGITHIIGPELGITQPGMTITCGDSHTSTHGAFGALAFGIGTSMVKDVLATQTIAITKPKVRKIIINGKTPKGVYAKDIILKVIQVLGINGGIGYAYEYSGKTVGQMTMEERMTLCNMSIESGASMGYVNPDQTTFDYLKGKEFAPAGIAFEKAMKYWKSIASSSNACYDDIVKMDISALEPMVSWGINPGQSMGISGTIPYPNELPEEARESANLAYEHMGFTPGQKLEGIKIDAAFIGSCTNGRISDLRETARIINGKSIAKNVRAIIIPGSEGVKKQAEKEGLDKIFIDAGFGWRGPGCSLCLGMNEDKLSGSELCASSSNRNFIGRQGSPKGRTILMSPAMVAIAAIQGKIADVRKHGGIK